MITVSIKKRDEATGQWKLIQAADLAGKSLLQFFQESEDKEIVAEVNLEGRRLFFCGTDRWVDRMNQQDKGEAISFDQAIQRLKKIRPELLAEKIPGLDIVADVFEGCKVVEHKIINSYNGE